MHALILLLQTSKPDFSRSFTASNARNDSNCMETGQPTTENTEAQDKLILDGQSLDHENFHGILKECFKVQFSPSAKNTNQMPHESFEECFFLKKSNKSQYETCETVFMVFENEYETLENNTYEELW